MKATPEVRDKRATALILLCWMAYAFSYVGKLSYTANISQFEASLGITHADAGIVSTFFFFAYGAGQVVNGILCKRYPIKWVIFSALLSASVLNVLAVLVPSFEAVKFIWLLNGVAMSFLWTSLIRLLSETLNKRDIPRAVFLMGTTVASGTLVVYGLSSLFAALGCYRVTFYIAAGMMTLAALVWVSFFGRLVPPLRAEREAERAEAVAAAPVGATEKRESMVRKFGFFLVVVICFAMANNFVKDGLTAWTPSMLNEVYQTPGWLSILLALLLPMLAILGAGLALRLQRAVGSFIGCCCILFGSSSLLILLVILLLPSGLLVPTVGAFGLVSCLMASGNNVITSMIPLHLKDHFNSGRLAGIINGFCYLGSTITTYGLGAIADRYEWSVVFYVLLGAATLVTLIGLVFLLVRGKRTTDGIRL